MHFSLRLLQKLASTAGLLLAFSLWWDATPALACKWRVSPDDLITPAQREALQRRYPRIEGVDQTSQLLSEINKIKTLLRLVVSKDGDICILSGKQAATIQDIDISLTTRMFKNALQTRMLRYLGQPDSPTLRDQIRYDIAVYLSNKGFLEPSVSISAGEGDQQKVELIIKVDENHPCYINKIVTDFAFPPSLPLKMQNGDICDMEMIAQTLTDLEDKIKELGYNQHQTLKGEFIYDKNKRSAILRIEGDLGKKIKYSVISPIKITLAGQISDIDPSITDPDIMRTEILRNYRNEGFDEATVDYVETNETGVDEKTHVFRVTPGTQYFVSQVLIEGISVFSLNECLNVMNLNNVITLNSIRLNSDFIRKGIESLTAAYNSKGYWNALIHYPRVTKNPLTGETKLVYTVQEGRQRIYQELSVTGNHAFSKPDLEQLFGKEKGSPLVWQDLVEFEKQLKLLYLKKGYIHAKFKFDLIEHELYKKIQVIFALTIVENNRIQIGDITLTGLVATQPIVVRRELRFVSGDWYDPDLVEKSRKALLNLGIFSTVEIIPTGNESLAEDALTIDYTVSVREAKPGTITFGPGFSIDDGARFEIESAYKNIGGLGRQIFAKGTLSEERRQQYIGRNTTMVGRSLGVGYIEPYLLGLPMNGTVKLNHQAIAGSNWESSRSGEVALSHTLRLFLPETELSGFYGQKITEIEARELFKVNLIETGNVRTGRIGLRWSADKRNNIAWPTAGYVLNTEVSWARYAFGGDLKYDKWMVTHSFYRGFTEDLVVALGYQLTAYDGVARKGAEADILPTSERLYTGGAETNRGFARESLGPLVTQYDEASGAYERVVVGGSRRAVYKAELRYQFAKDYLATSLFFDASNNFFTPHEKRLFDATFMQTSSDPAKKSTMYDNASYNFEEIVSNPSNLWYRNYVSSGLALNLLTPLGAINLSYGIPIKRYPGKVCLSDECIPRGRSVNNILLDGVFHVNVGATF